MAKAKIETRYETSGFVYTDRTRMLFAPKFTVTRNPEDRPPEGSDAKTDIVLCVAQNHLEPTKRDIAECRDALKTKYPENRIFVDTAEGLVPIYEPVVTT